MKKWYIGVLVCIAMTLAACSGNGTSGNSTPDEIDTSSVSNPGEPVFEEYKLHDMIFRVPDFMDHEKKSGESDILLYGEWESHNFTDSTGTYKIQFVHSDYVLLTTPNGAAASLFQEVTGSPIWSEPMEEVIINGTSWFHEELTEEMDDDNLMSRMDVYVYCDGFSRYVINFLYTNKADVEYSDLLLPHVFMDYGNQLTSETLVGEWDGDDAGYLVIEDDGTLQWFMDSSKGEDNVLTATYQLFDKKHKERMAESDDYYYVIMNFNTNVIGGVRRDTDYLREYCFSVDGDTLYTTNIYTSATPTFTRVVENNSN